MGRLRCRLQTDDTLAPCWDRNGLRPSRFTVTSDDIVVLASETGVLDFDPATIVRKGRLQPGKMFLVDLKEQRIIEDEEIKATISGKEPYAGMFGGKPDLHGRFAGGKKQRGFQASGSAEKRPVLVRLHTRRP